VTGRVDPVGLLGELEYLNRNTNVEFIPQPLVLEVSEAQKPQAQSHDKTAKAKVTKKQSVSWLRLR